jgi:von Willebrand factor type A domain
MSTSLHLAVLVMAALYAVDSRRAGRLDSLEVSAITRESEDLQPLAVTPLIEVTAPPSLKTGSSDVVDSANGTKDGLFAVEAADNHWDRPQLARNGSPLGSQWLSESRSTGGLADVVGAVVGLNGPDAEGNVTAGRRGGPGEHRASFFGISAAARRIVFVVDASASMNRPYPGEGKTRFGQMKLELAKSLLGLMENQQFFIIFFNEHALPMPADSMENAYPQNQQRFIEWVAAVPASGLTDPRPALTMAFGLRPDVIYLLTDGTFPRDVQSDLRALKRTGVELNTIAFGDPRAEKSLRPLAQSNGGRFVFVP